MFNSILSLVTVALAASSVLASPSPSRTITKRATGLNPDVASIATPLAALVSRGLNTNARRFAAGLPPVAPRARSHKASRAVPSGTPSNVGYLSVIGSDGTDYGYLSRELNTFGEYGLFTTNAEDAIKIAFDASETHNLDLVASNSYFTDLPFIGGVVGFASTSSSLTPSSAAYIFVSATSNTAALSAPVALENAFTKVTAIEKEGLSAVWEFDAATSTITPQWVNEDSSLPASTLVYVPEEQALAIVGDVAAFQASFGVTTPTITFKFVAA